MYGAVLTGLFTVSTIFHTVAAISDKRYIDNIFFPIKGSQFLKCVVSILTFSERGEDVRVTAC